MSDQPRPPRRHADVIEPQIFGGIEKREIVIAEADPLWGQAFDEHRERIDHALGEIPHRIEHIGSTSVPGLAAKPIIDILLLVDDVTAEEDFLDPLLRARYLLRIREPGHRMLRTPELDVHVHILGASDPAAGTYLLLRDRLRSDRQDRELYEQTKRTLAARDWPDMNAYADAKSAVIAEILRRSRAD